MLKLVKPVHACFACRRGEQQRLYDQVVTYQVLEDLLAKLRSEMPMYVCVVIVYSL